MQLADQHEVLVFDYRAAEDGHDEMKAEPLTLHLTESQYCILCLTYDYESIAQWFMNRSRGAAGHSRFECCIDDS